MTWFTHVTWFTNLDSKFQSIFAFSRCLATNEHQVSNLTPHSNTCMQLNCQNLLTIVPYRIKSYMFWHLPLILAEFNFDFFYAYNVVLIFFFGGNYKILCQQHLASFYQLMSQHLINGFSIDCNQRELQIKLPTPRYELV